MIHIVVKIVVLTISSLLKSPSKLSFINDGVKGAFLLLHQANSMIDEAFMLRQLAFRSAVPAVALVSHLAGIWKIDSNRIPLNDLSYGTTINLVLDGIP